MIHMLNPFIDGRPIPNIKVNFKVKIKTKSTEESSIWNSFFAYVMGKPRTKIEFITVALMRNFSLSTIKVEDLNGIITEEDYEKLLTVEEIFNERLPVDLKAFILSVFQVPIPFIKEHQ